METRIKTALDGFRKSVLDAHGMDFLIVGSLALHELGMETGEPHDIDMEVKVKEKEPYEGPILLETPKGDISLSYKAAQRIFVDDKK